MEKYKNVRIEAVYPDGTIMVRNAFIQENKACSAGDPDWPREKLVKLAFKTLIHWIEAYPHHPARLRLAK